MLTPYAILVTMFEGDVRLGEFLDKLLVQPRKPLQAILQRYLWPTVTDQRSRVSDKLIGHVDTVR